MKKIMFNDKYGLTRAVLEGRKTQTRRLINVGLQYIMSGTDEIMKQALLESARYKKGEIVAVAQSYQDANWYGTMSLGPGKYNKMFVKGEYMPHRIKITNVRIERLQDISDDDCLKEGLEYCNGGYYVNYGKETCSRTWLANTLRKAFAYLIDKVSGKGTWESNPYVFVYDFELLK